MANSMQTILYIMRHIDIGGYIDIPYKKIGITGAGNATLSTRLQQISNTKSPIKAQCIAAWKVNDAKKLENALHTVLSNERVEGEWFYDKDDDLVDRMAPLLELLNAEKIEIEDNADSYTRNIIQKENSSKHQFGKMVLGEISEKLIAPLRTSIRVAGPTFFSDRTSLTYYVNIRKSGNHNLNFGRSKGRYEEIEIFLQEQGFDVEQHERGYAMLHGLTSNTIAELINSTETNFDNNQISQNII